MAARVPEALSHVVKLDDDFYRSVPVLPVALAQQPSAVPLLRNAADARERLAVSRALLRLLRCVLCFAAASRDPGLARAVVAAVATQHLYKTLTLLLQQQEAADYACRLLVVELLDDVVVAVDAVAAAARPTVAAIAATPATGQPAGYLPNPQRSRNSSLTWVT